jgi:hypothetical protein
MIPEFLLGGGDAASSVRSLSPFGASMSTHFFMDLTVLALRRTNPV